MPDSLIPEVPMPAKPARSKAPLVYAAIALVVLAAVWWSFGGGEPVGAEGYAKVKDELVQRLEAWREKGVRLESVPASAVDGPLVRYVIDPPSAPIGDQDTAHTFVVHCTFRDARGMETESKVTVTIESKRLRFWNLFSK